MDYPDNRSLRDKVEDGEIDALSLQKLVQIRNELQEIKAASWIIAACALIATIISFFR